MSATLEILLAEYADIRRSIDRQIQIYFGLVGLTLAALGTGLATVITSPQTGFALALTSIFLWNFWTDTNLWIAKNALYLDREVVPKIRLESGSADILQWERFHRQLAQGGSVAAKAVGAEPGEPTFPHYRTTGFESLYLMFILAPLALATISTLSIALTGTGIPSIWGVSIANLFIVTMWLWALASDRSFRRFLAATDRAILRDDDGIGEQTKV